MIFRQRFIGNVWKLLQKLTARRKLEYADSFGGQGESDVHLKQKLCLHNKSFRDQNFVGRNILLH